MSQKFFILKDLAPIRVGNDLLNARIIKAVKSVEYTLCEAGTYFIFVHETEKEESSLRTL